MNLEDLKDTIVEELGQLSGMTVSPAEPYVLGAHPHLSGYSYLAGTENPPGWVWSLHEDPNKSDKDSDWITKKATTQLVGQVILQETKLYFKPEISQEKIYLADLIEPDSFDKAIAALKAALNVANICKTPFGTPIKFPPRF